jgi:hypothetical protein
MKLAMADSVQSDQSVVPVGPERHGTRRWRRFTSYSFARPLRDVAVVLAEIEPAASAFPLVFKKKNESWDVLALLAVSDSTRGIFVTRDGNWRGTYVPSGLRAYPFIAETTGADGQNALMIDESSGLVTDDPQDELFFDENGQVARALTEVITFFQTRAASQVETRVAAKALADAGVLTELTPSFGMTAEDAAGYWVVDLARFTALPEHLIADLWAVGALRLAQAQLVSMYHLGWIARATSAGLAEVGTTSASSHKTEPPQTITSFLSAVADARAAETGEQE